MRKKVPFILFGFVFLIVAIFIIIGGIKKKNVYGKCDVETVGYLQYINSYETTQGSGKDKTFVTKYSGHYSINVNGTEYAVNGSDSGHRSENTVPSTVSVVYQSDSPSNCYIKGDTGTTDIICGIVFIVFAFIWIIVLALIPANKIHVQSRHSNKWGRTF